MTAPDSPDSTTEDKPPLIEDLMGPPVQLEAFSAADGVPDRRARRAGVAGAFRAIKSQRAAERTLVEIFAEGVTKLVSTLPMLVLHIVWFAVWIIWNSGRFGLTAFDPYPFGLLTMIVSLEAIFLSLLVLLAQGREAGIAELREEITLAVNLRMEEEVTKTLQLVAGLYTRLGHRLGDDPELRDMLKPLDALGIEKELQEQLLESSKLRRPRDKDGKIIVPNSGGHPPR